MTRLLLLLTLLVVAPVAAQSSPEAVRFTASNVSIDGTILHGADVEIVVEGADLTPSPADGETIDALMAAMYDVLSGPSDQPRDWDRFRSLFADGGRMVPMQPSPDGGLRPDVRSLDRYTSDFDQILAEHPLFQGKGFYESEAARRVEQYGDIAVVWSTYEGRFSPDDERPFMRGVNTLDLVRVGGEWKVLQVLWQQETPQTPLPAEYLTSPEE